MPICRKYGLNWTDVTDDVNNPEGDIVSWGYVSEDKKLELLSRAHALVFPSMREGWGIPIIEAGCVGTPCIAFDSPGICEAVDYGKAGYLCDENTVDGLAAKMELCVSDTVLYNDIQEKAYRYSSQFRWENAGMEFERFMEQMAVR